MEDKQPVYLKDYQSPKFTINKVNLHFELNEDKTIVTSILDIERTKDASKSDSLILDGEDLILKSVQVDGNALSENEYNLTKKSLTILNVPDKFIVETVVEIDPDNNTSLNGLYRSQGNYCTQCEPQGFRRITYYIDRPDVMAKFTTSITSDPKKYPFALSNGNLVGEKTLEDGRRWVMWEDPFLKPSYLFALVAGDFDLLTDKFTTMSGREVDLHVYVEKGFGDQADHAMLSIKHSMKWDEEVYGREYDLDIYMLVAVSDFNMGAMENKGLNIFNTQYVLGVPETATDKDFIAIEEVIGHEYFHNWSGNRVTVRDWFQLSLKEGLTIFRDQSFTADMTNHAVKRIDDVGIIQSAQFAEDAGPSAHPVRPDHYIEMNNFYTLTVYHKGAELIRMMSNLLGPEKFRKAMDLYFNRHDGQAVTTEDFVKAMEDGGDIDLTQFRLWYTQSGTPQLQLSSSYDQTAKTFTLEVLQSCPATPGQKNKQPFHIPLSIALIDPQGCEVPLQLEGEVEQVGNERVLDIKQKHEKFVFVNVNQKPVPSLLRHFSAPVKLDYKYDDKELIFLFKHDSDDYNRWYAGQVYMTKHLMRLTDAAKNGETLSLPSEFIDSIRNALHSRDLDGGLIARAVTLPPMDYLIQLIDEVDVDALSAAYDFMRKDMSDKLHDDFWMQYQYNQEPREYTYSVHGIAQRSLKNVCLNYLLESTNQADVDLAVDQFEKAQHMTDQIGALSALNNIDVSARDKALSDFYEKFQNQPLVVDKWFALQASSSIDGALTQIKGLMDHPDFSIKNPNKVRSLIGSYARFNYKSFHAIDGTGYQFLREQIMVLDDINPQMAARLVGSLTQWHQFDKNRQKMMIGELEIILNKEGLSGDVYELVKQSLEFVK